MTFRAILISLAVISLISCSDGPKVNDEDIILRDMKFNLKSSTEPFTGVGVKYYSSGEKKSEIRYKDGFLHGISYSYYRRSGNKELELKWERNHKLWSKTWYATGERRNHMKYTGDNTNSGLMEVWWPNGNRKEITSIKYGQIVPGSQTRWYESGDEIK